MSSDPSFEIHFKPKTFAAFGGRRGHWTKYDLIDEAAMTSITVEPSLIRIDIDSDLIAFDLDCYFDPALYDTETFGHVYGDGEFEDGVSEWLRGVFGIEEGQEGDVFYTESGAQQEDKISMELDAPFRQRLLHLGNHALLTLTRHSDIKSILTPHFEWTAPSQDPERQTDAS